MAQRENEMTDQERKEAIDRILGGYTQEQLEAAFRVVQPATQWKDAIRAIIPASMRQVVEKAVIHFTGSVPTFTPCPNGQLEVKAAGYYAAIGA